MEAEQLKRSMLLWLPGNDPEMDYEAEIARVTEANRQVLAFIDREMTLAELVERIDHYERNIDAYLDNLGNTLDYLGA